MAGGVDETVARLPSAMAATMLVLGVAVAATRYYGAGIGVLAGAVQATTAWAVLRGRLAEADMLLACLVTWAIVAFDRMCDAEADSRGVGWRRALGVLRLAGATSTVKGIGFGAAMTCRSWRSRCLASRRRGGPPAPVPGSDGSWRR